jgi:hypothetical protein
VVEGDWVKDPAFKCYFRDVVASVPKSFKGGEKLLHILFRRLKFADRGFRELHQKHICKFNYLSFKPQFLPPMNGVGFLEVV